MNIFYKYEPFLNLNTWKFEHFKVRTLKMKIYKFEYF